MFPTTWINWKHAIHSLDHCTTQTGINGKNENKPDFNRSANDINVKSNAFNLHNTCSNSSTNLSEKLSSVLDPKQISKLIKEHAELMTRPSPPTPRQNTCSKSPSLAQKEVCF